MRHNKPIMVGHSTQTGAQRSSPSGGFALLPTAAAFMAIWLVFSWPWLSGTYTIPWDGKAHFAPQVQFMAASFARGDWPFWTPNVFAGHPQIADPQSMLFSPPMVALAVLDGRPGPWAIDLVVLLMLAFAGLSTLAFARQQGWHWAAGLIAAIAFAFGAAMAWRLQHFGQVMSLAYLPATLFCLHRAIRQSSVMCGILAGLLGAFIVLGRDQVGLIAVYIAAGYAIWLIFDGNGPWQRLRSAIVPLLAGGAISLLVVIVPLLLTLALAEQSNRPQIDFTGAGAGSLHPTLLVTALVPHLFGAAGDMADYWGPPSFTWQNTGLYIAQNMGIVYLGIMPLGMIAYGLARGYLLERPIRFFSIAWLLVIFYALGWYTPVFRVFYEFLPGVAFYRRPADAVFLIGGLGALLAGYAGHRIIGDFTKTANVNRPAEFVLIATVSVPMSLAIAFAWQFDRLQQAAPPLLFAAGWLAATALCLALAIHILPIRPIAAGSLLVAVTAADLIANNGPNGASALPSASLAMLEPDTRDATITRLKRLIRQSASTTRRDRIEMVGLGYHWPNTALTHGLHSTLGANPVRLRHYVAATGAGDTAALGGQRHFPPLFPSYRSPLADLLGLRFIATGEPIEQIDRTLKPGDLPIVAQIGRTRIYENRNALPRVQFATKVRQVRFDKIVRTGNWPTTDFATTLLLETPSPTNGQRRPGNVAITSYRNTGVVVDVESPDGGWVVLNDVWHPWWVGRIDGKPADVLKANVLFRAIAVPSGRHKVSFEFHPVRGALASLLSRSKPRPTP